MNGTRFISQPALLLACGILLWVAAPREAQAATTNISIVNFAFSPSAVTIKVNDTVTWTWAAADDGTPHSTTSNQGLWDSGIQTEPATFSHTFTNAGSFPFHCAVHSFMTGSITVQAASVPPSISLTAPTNGATFAAPWTGTVSATVSDSDATVTNVQFFAGTTSLGIVNNPGANPSITVTNLAAGNYTLTAEAEDTLGATGASAGVSISVVTPSPIRLSSLSRPSSTSFQFSYSTTAGLSYIVQRSQNLASFTPLATNTAASSTATFLDTNATGPVNYYSVKLQPNP